MNCTMPRKKRRRAWGSIDPVKPNAKYVLRWMENTPEGRRRRCETFYGTYREADLRLAQIRVERAAARPDNRRSLQDVVSPRT